jgi:hypothetical protein
MSFIDNLLGGAGRDDLKAGYSDSRSLLGRGLRRAKGYTTRGTEEANALLKTGEDQIGDDAGTFQNALISAGERGVGYYKPYLDAGSNASTLYGDALGANGIDRQRAFGAHYAAYNPFRAQNEDFANEALMRVLNARGLSGSGYAGEAVARQSLARGSEDYQNFLNHLANLSSRGLSAAAGAAGTATGTAATRAGTGATFAGLRAGNLRTRAGNIVDRDRELANLYYGNAQQVASLRNQLANAEAQGAQAGVNNLFNMFTKIASAAIGAPGGAPGGTPGGTA